MKHKHHTQQQQNAGPARAAAMEDFIPAPDEVAKQAYFNYVNEGSESGHDVQHWLAAEAQLVARHHHLRLS